MKTPTRIIAAVDRSNLAIRVIRNAIDLAKSTDARLDFLFVKVPCGEPSDKSVDVHRRQFIGEQIVSQDAQHLIVKHSSVEADNVAPAVVAYASEHLCDLIVIGSHGRRGFRKLMLGSVALEVIRLARCPVFTIGAHDETDAGHNPLAHILVPFDFSEPSMKALEYAARLAEKLNANLEVLHIIEDTFYPAFYGPFVHSIYESSPDIEELVKEKMRRSADIVEFDARRLTVSVQPGHPGSEIACYAGEHSVDLIVMATHGLSGIQHLFMGSVAERTAQLATCPTLTIRVDQARTANPMQK